MFDVESEEVYESLLEEKILDELYGVESRLSFEQFLQRFSEKTEWLHSAEDIQRLIK